ncbi:Protein tramtrack, alpha isoform [Cyphomyrmex costatus]|uniref:Protein tramtrack, alpha isoform n=1 Tax=Cyphomyrmex costatus TaxID=456900 RepID=A0A195CQB4_9HYME|nr:Protein tramtrack, alpha isoform [Cyphomyrmex costatus]
MIKSRNAKMREKKGDRGAQEKGEEASNASNEYAKDSEELDRFLRKMGKQKFSSIKTDNGNETWKEKTRGLNTGASPAATSIDVSSPNSSSSSSPSNARANTSSSTSTTNAAPATTNASGAPTTTSAGGTLTRSSASPASRNSSGGSTNTNIGTMSAPSGRQAPKRRMRRRATSQSQDPAEQLTEMSVRGLNLFRYASISEGVYQCTECAKLDIQKTFKNKYSFQRHAFLYHEGHQRKVFPCPVCAKEFSRPDKMKNHMKTVHDCFMPKDCVMPFSFFMPDQLPSQLLNDITFEVCSSSSSPPSPAAPASSASSSAAHGGDDKEDTGSTDTFIKTEKVSGVHFLTNRTEEDQDQTDLLLPKSEVSENEPEVRKQLLEYLIQNDGSVVCKWCGEVLPSRTRWYRHKYKLHVSTQVAQPAPLFRCHSCNTYFKSRKGYIGHLSSRHSDNENDENREEPTNKKSRKISTDACRGPDWELQREKEEKLVADIIDRVKRECEAQGETVTRRGYSRRSTIMNS